MELISAHFELLSADLSVRLANDRKRTCFGGSGSARRQELTGPAHILSDCLCDPQLLGSMGASL